MKKIIEFKPPGNIKRGYRQKEFMITSFSIGKDTLKPLTYKQVEKFIDILIDLGFNQTEMGWADHDTTVQFAPEICEKKNFNLILQDVAVFGGAGLNESIRPPVNDETISGIVEKYKKYNCIKGFYIWDEAFHKEDIEKAALLTNLFYKYAPDKFNLAILIPSYNPVLTWENGNFEPYVKEFVNAIEPPVICFDYYPYGVSPQKDDEYQLDTSNLWKDLGAMRAEGLKRNIPFWFYYQACRVNPYPYFEPSMIRLQLNYALMYGAKGLQCYGLSGTTASMYNWEDKYMVVDHNFNKGVFYSDFKRYIRATKNLGKTFIGLTSKHIYHDEDLLKGHEDFDELYREDIKTEKLFKMDKLQKRCSVGTFEDPAGNDYFCILNRDFKVQNTFTLNFNEKVRLYEVSSADGEQFVSHENIESLTITLDPGDMRLYRVQKADEEAYTIEYICEDK